MIYKELLQWRDRAIELDEILQETRSLEIAILRATRNAALFFPKMIKGVVRKPKKTQLSIDDILGNNLVYSRGGVWLTPACVGYRRYSDSTSTIPFDNDQVIRMLKKGDPILFLVEKHTHKDEYVKKIKLLVKCFKRLKYAEDNVYKFPIKPYSVTTTSEDVHLGNLDRPVHEHHISAVRFHNGKILLKNHDVFNRRYSGETVLDPTVFAAIQPGYLQIKMAAKKYRTALRNMHKHNAKVIDDLERGLAPWLVLGAL